MDGGGGDVCCLPMVGWGMFIRPILLLELFCPQGSGWNLFCFVQPVVDRSIRVEHLSVIVVVLVARLVVVEVVLVLLSSWKLLRSLIQFRGMQLGINVALYFLRLLFNWKFLEFNPSIVPGNVT